MIKICRPYMWGEFESVRQCPDCDRIIINRKIHSKGYQDAFKAFEERQAQDREIRQGEDRAQASADVGLKEDRSEEFETAKSGE